MSHSPSQDWSPDKGRRRSLRVLLTVPVTVNGTDASGQPFIEETKTLVVNAHGALVLLANRVASGQTVTLTNKATRINQSCRVAYHGPMQGGKAQVGVEFAQFSPGFWQINFPPEDWKVPES